MSILNVNQIQPVGSGQTVTISATNISAGSATVTAGTFSGNLTGNVTSSGISTFSDTVNVGAGKSIRLYGATSGYSEIIAAAGSASTTFTLPANGGSSGEYLQTNGSGELSWAAAGKILQVVTQQYATATTVSLTAGTHVDVGFNVTITPTTSNSVMLVAYSLMGEVSSPWDSMAAFSRTISGTRTVVLPTGFGSRNEGIITMGDSHGATDDGSTPGVYSLPLFPDTGRPANTNPITYTPTVMHASAATYSINRDLTDTDNTSYERGISWITVMEVAA